MSNYGYDIPSLSRRAVTAVLLIVLSWTLVGCDLSEAPRDGSAVICREPVWNLGRITLLKPHKLTHDFTLTNTTEQYVSITDITTDCGCLKPAKYPNEIKPGESVKLPIGITLTHPQGQMRKRVVVHLGAASVPSKVLLEIRGSVAGGPSIVASPRQINFGTITNHSVQTRIVRIYRLDGSPVNLRKTDVGSAALHVDVDHSTGSEAVMSFRVSLDPTVLSAFGDFGTEVAVETSHPDFPTIKIPVAATIRIQ